MATSPSPVETGRLLGGRYRVGPRLAGGGTAEVFVGEDRRLGRGVAIKVLRPDSMADPEARRRFETEGRAVARLSHPNVVCIYDVGNDEGSLYLVMELVSGGSLAGRIRSGPLSQAAARRVGLDILAGLAAAHAAGILHRDVKPANVLIDEHGTAKLADFGIAKSDRSGLDATTATAMVLGTPSYLAPERAVGAPARVESDLWSVGVVLYEALTAAKPFQGPTSLAVALAARNGDYVPLAERRPDIDPALTTAVQRALSPDPADRFPNAAAMADAVGDHHGWGLPAGAAPAADITAVLQAPPTDTLEEPTDALEENAIHVGGRSRARSGRARLALGTTVALVALVAVVVAWVLSAGSHPAPTRQMSPTTLHARATTTIPVSTTPPSTTPPPTTNPPPPTTNPPPPGHSGRGKHHGHGN